MNNTPDSPAKTPDDRTDQGGNYWTLFTPGIWKVLHAVLQIRLPIGTLSEDDRQFIDTLVARTLSRPEVIAAVRQRFPQGRKGGVGSC
jgi:hypothetical protein